MENDIEITDSKKIADAFNNYFANIGNNIANSVPSVETSYLHFMKTSVCKSLYIFPVTSTEIEEENL